MTPNPIPPTTHLQAVVLALTGYTCWVFADTNLKIAGRSHLPAYQVIALVGFAIAALLTVRAALRGELRALWPRNPLRQLLRASLDLGNNLCVVVALRHLPLALFYILIFLAPLVTTLLAAAFLGERLQWNKASPTLLGFLGVVIAVNPFGARSGDLVGYAACAVCVVCFSANMVWSRRITQTETPASLTFFSGLVQAAACGTAMLTHAEPIHLRLALVLLLTAAFCVVGSLCFFRALRSTSAATVSQYHYSQLLTGALVAWLLWREALTPSMLLGATLIVAAGVYTALVSPRHLPEPLPALQI